MYAEVLLLLLGGAGLMALASGGDDADDAPADSDTVIRRIAGTDDDDDLGISTGGTRGETVILEGGDGDDMMWASDASDNGTGDPIHRAELYGGDGNDTIYGFHHADEVLLDGGAGNDAILGDATSWTPDTLRGGDGDDWLGSAADTIEGGAGNDTLVAFAVSPAGHTEAVVPGEPTPGTVYDPNMDDTPTVLTGGAGADSFTLGAGNWVERYDDIPEDVRPSPQMNDVIITDFDPSADRLVLPEKVGAFHSRQFADPGPGDILNTTASFDGITVAPTEDGAGTILTITYVPDQEADLAPLTVRVTLATVARFDPGSVTFRPYSAPGHDQAGLA